MRKQINAPLPAWATSAADIAAVGLPTGFLKGFLDYVTVCTDAPSSFALGTGLGILAVAAGKCQVVVTSSNSSMKGVLPIRLWQALIGNSGARKSKVMELGVGLLQRAGTQFLLPDDASVEAWHDTLAEQPTSLLYQEELSGLLDAAQRSYGIGLQSWLLKMWGGTPKDRKTKGGGLKTVERPRLSILGAIPPDVFQKKTQQGDWRSGFLPRFIYWGGTREEWSEVPCVAPLQEDALAKQLQYTFLPSCGDICLSGEVARIITDWFFKEIEAKSTTYSEDTYSALLRLQEAGYIITALVAFSQIHQPIKDNAASRLLAKESDALVAIKILQLCKNTIEIMCSYSHKDEMALDEQLIIETLRQTSKIAVDGTTVTEMAARLGMSIRKTRSLMNELVVNQMLIAQPILGKTFGRPLLGYKLAKHYHQPS